MCDCVMCCQFRTTEDEEYCGSNHVLGNCTNCGEYASDQNT
jgi:hypothetical protein